jgi:hypothetical protein
MRKGIFATVATEQNYFRLSQPFLARLPQPDEASRLSLIIGIDEMLANRVHHGRRHCRTGF